MIGSINTIINGFFNGGGSSNDDFVRGNGKITSESRDVKGFTEIKTNGSSDVFVSYASEFKVVVEAEENILPSVDTRLFSDLLLIDMRGAFQTSKGVKVHIFMPYLTQINANGSGDIRVTGFKHDILKLSLNGSGDFVIEGEADLLAIQKIGSGDVDASKLEANTIDLTSAGSGDLELNCKLTLSYDMTGSGDLEIQGKPRKIYGSIRGSGELHLK
jgi:hypothetical protein